MARGLGIDLSQYQDDQAALRHLADGYRQAQANAQLARYGQQYLQVAPEFQQWQQERERQAREQQGAQKKWWEPPEFDPRWRGQVTRDEQGNLVPVPGAPADVVAKFQKYGQWLLDQQDKFWADPVGAIKPGIEELVGQMIEQRTQQAVQQYHEQQASNSYVAQNAGWLFQVDPQTRQPVVNPQTGQRVLSPYGQSFAAYVIQAEQQLGIRNVDHQRRYAQAMVERDILIAGQGQSQAAQQATQTRDTANQQYLEQAAQRTPSVLTQLPGSNPTPPASPRASLGEMLRRNLQAAGVTDATLATERE